MNKLIITSIFIFLSSAFYANGQSQNHDQKFEYSIEIESTFLNETRSISIHLPKSYYQSNTLEYPVFYVLDAQNLQKHTSFIYEYLSEKGHIPEMITVFIPHTNNRIRDYKTFFRDSEKINPGADLFLEFIDKELIPMVDKKFRSAEYKLLSGHSNSGLFVIHSLIKKPELFNARFAFSPSSHHIPKQRELLIDVLKSNNKLKSYFYMNVGGSEFYKMTDAFNELQEIFKKYAPGNLRFDFDYLDVDGHQSSPYIGQHLAFKRLYAPLKLKLSDYREKSADEILHHFEQVSNEFGYTVTPKENDLKSVALYFLFNETSFPILDKINSLYTKYFPTSEATIAQFSFVLKWLKNGRNVNKDFYINDKPEEVFLNRLSYNYLKQNQLDEALYLFKLAIDLYPNSYNVYDSYAEVLEKKGDFRGALKHYRKAYKLVGDSAEESGYLKENIERVTAKLKFNK